MKTSFYIKLFGAFAIFIMILLLFINVAFNNFYSIYGSKIELKKVEYILDTQALKFENYIKNYTDKLLFIEPILSKINNQNEIKNLVNDSLFQDLNIVTFRVVDFDSKESLKLVNKNIKENNFSQLLKSIFMEPYFKELQSLNKFDTFQYCEDEDNNFLNFAIRGEEKFYIFKVDLKTILYEISSSYDKKILIKDTRGHFLENGINEVENDEYIYKKVYIKSDKFYTFLINKNIDEKNSFIKDYYRVVVFIVFVLALILSAVFTYIINKENKKIKDENKKLNFDIVENSLVLNENQKIMNEHIMFIQIDKYGIINEVSIAFSDFLGYSRSELLGHSYKLFVFKDMKQVFKKAVKNELNKSIFELRNVQGKRKNLESFWIDIFVEEQIENNQTIAYNIICQDATDKKRIYKLYKDLNLKIEEYDAIFENVQSGIALLDLENKFVKVNNKISELLGYSKDEILKLSPIDIVSNSSKKLLENMLRDIADFTKVLKIEKIFIKKDNTPIHLELSLILLAKKARIIFIINSLEDKRKLQELNLNLEKRIKKELEKSKTKDKIHYQEQIKSAKLSYIGVLSAGITHEINTPLTYVKGNLELMHYDIEALENSDIKNRMLQDSKKIKEGLNRIANIVESMREISHSNEGEKTDFNVYATILTALTMAHNRAKHISKIYLNGEIFDINNIDNNRFIFKSNIQKQRIEQIWIIIINNALDELVKIEDYENRELKIDILEEKNTILVRFKDNAGGLNKEILKKLFEPFTSSKSQGGMGIGLSIAKKIIEEHNGSIKAYNEDNGALFEIRLKKIKEDKV